MSTGAHRDVRALRPVREQRRSAFRIDAFLPVRFWVGDVAAGPPHESTTHDISATGLSFTDHPGFALEPDAALVVELVLPDALVPPPLRLRGHLVPGAARQDVRAFHATHCGQADRDRLFRYVLMREREAIAWVRGS